MVAAIRSNIRSYEPIVRFGGDEFVCAITDLDEGLAESRFDEIRNSIEEREGERRISVGLAELRPDDRLAELVDRADKALLACAAGRDRAARTT